MVRRLNFAGICLAILLCIAVIVALALDVRHRLEALARASSDSVQWALAQLEVETQLMRETLSAPEPDLAEIRKRFDIFFSRMMIFETGTPYVRLRERPEFLSGLDHIRDFLERTLPLMDGPDDQLRAAIPELRSETFHCVTTFGTCP
ncbi:MAG: hypothetical protein DI533_07385 [Cereibacter sphaeroides]|uniref:Uncharacterized protein n=1 Tax=Cereibacter sphaeroides TaxID=1063 RepID=A0A2W5SDY6_CERSP|nr:MAG: hypothetical protein DI533_07385 [Cereibacter sphaeroides]